MQELEDLKSDHKRLENDKIMSSKDHETERALLKSHIDNLEKQLKDRDVLLRDLEGSKESEVSEARAKNTEIKQVRVACPSVASCDVCGGCTCCCPHPPCPAAPTPLALQPLAPLDARWRSRVTTR